MPDSMMKEVTLMGKKEMTCKRIFGILLAGVLIFMTSACGTSADTSAEATMEASAEPTEESTENDEQGTEVKAEDKDADDAGEESLMFSDDEEEKKEAATETASEEQPELSPELQAIQDDLQNVKYNGFLTEEYTKPEDIDWSEVLYVGAGLYDDEKYADIYEDVKKEYIAAIGGDGYDVEEFGLDIFDGQKLRDYVEGTSGLSASDVKLPLEYFKKWDIYAASGTGDTNQIGVAVISAEKDDDGVYSVKYLNAEKPFLVKMKENGDYWQFISNEWDPDNGRKAAIHETYSEIISKYSDALTQGWDKQKLKDEKLSNLCLRYAGDADALEKAGYYLYDVDGDGTDELFIGEKAGDGTHANVWQMYYIRMGRCSWDAKSDEDDIFYLADDGTFYEESSKKAGEEKLTHDELWSTGPVEMLNQIDSVIYTESGDAGADKPWYYGQGYGFEKESISKKKYDDYINKAEKSYVDIDYRPLSEWNYDEVEDYDVSEDLKLSCKLFSIEMPKETEGLFLAHIYDNQIVIYHKQSYEYWEENYGFAAGVLFDFIAEEEPDFDETDHYEQLGYLEDASGKKYYVNISYPTDAQWADKESYDKIYNMADEVASTLKGTDGYKFVKQTEKK